MNHDSYSLRIFTHREGRVLDTVNIIVIYKDIYCV